MDAPQMGDLPTAGLLGLAYNVLSSAIFERVAEAGYSDLRPAHGNVMEPLSFADGLRLTDLAARAGITPQSMGELVDELEELGYVERRPDPSDRRAKRIHLTARGRRNVRDALEIVRGIEQGLETLLGKATLRTLRKTLLDLAGSSLARPPRQHPRRLPRHPA